MKKLLILIMLAAVLFSISIPAFAAANTYELDELGLSITMPVGYLVMTRNTPENSSVFSELGLTKAEMTEFFEANNIYLNGVSETFSEEISITMMEDSISNLKWFSNDQLLQMAKSVADKYQESGFLVFKYDVYQHQQTKFIKIYCEIPSQNAHVLQYFTVYDNKAIYITMYSFMGSLLSTQETAIQMMVESVRFEGETDSGKDTEPFLYTDSESGIAFTVPANWEREYYGVEGVQFSYTKEDSFAIAYRKKDMWASLTPEEKEKYAREDISSSEKSFFQLALLMGIPMNEVLSVTYNGLEYIKYENTFTEEVYGVEISLTVTQLIYVDNGWVYVFEFNGTSDHVLYADFESLVKSVKYPTVVPEIENTPPSEEPSEPATSTPSTDPSTGPALDRKPSSDEENNNTGMILAIVLVGVLAIVVGVIVVLRKKNQKDALEFCSSPSQPQKTAEKKIVCQNCGQLLPSDSAFCHVCGTKIDKES